MRTRVALVACLVASLLLATIPADAQNKRTGTSAASELLIPVGARDLAMGGAAIATSTGVEAMYWNPAGLGRISGSAEGMFSSMNYIADIGVVYGAVGARFGDFGVVGLSIKSLDFGDIPLTTAEDPEGRSGRLFSPTFVTIGLSYARDLTDAISAGGTAKLITEQIDRVSASGFALDFGIQYNGLVGIRGLQLGVAVKNIGPQMKFDGPGLYRSAVSSEGQRPEQKYKTDAASFELPSVIEIGLAYRASLGESLQGVLSSSFTNNSLYLDEYRLGGEVAYGMEALKLFLRGGFGFVPQADKHTDVSGVQKSSDIFGATVGAGITYAAPGIDITVDYAWRQAEFFDANQVISIKLGF